MVKKQVVRVAIKRDDIISISEFSRRFRVGRPKVYALIAKNMLNTEVICGQTFISIADRAIINDCLKYKTVRSRNQDFGMPPIPKGSEQDMEYERKWRKSMGIE